MRIAALLFASAAVLLAGPPIEDMKKQTVLIIMMAKTSKGVMTGTGSGVVVDPTHVVTNHHVCCEVPPGAPSKVVIARSPEETIDATVIWKSEEKDLAILELAKPVQAPKVVFATKAKIRIGEPVWAVGFPGSAMRLGNQTAVYESTVTQGVASRIFQGPTEEGGVEYVQTTAAVNPGNSGGPLFDDCGQVVAINRAKALSSIGGKTVTFAEGINLSIIVDEVVSELSKNRIEYTIGNACQAPGVVSSIPSWMLGSQAITLLVALGAIGLAMNRKVRQTVARSVHLGGVERKTPPAPRSPGGKPMLVGSIGPYHGQRIPLGEKPVVIGRDAAASNLVLPENTPGVSKRHCQMSVDRSGRFFVEDLFSSHGTFRNGQKIDAGRPLEIRPGDRITLGGPQVGFEVNLD
ncbi:trypsin-like peptidase domain-containing protein [uncultured Paludibaculum sp.]|uniref:trypsin-like peptidase domain-containing protein n=1 Tax=uncultured Paludibaculum sp. TaxID=1765020 RepID=UPI002AAAD959|nr:trypsin-like peptidase domain-containing protein [uncultured Paludibaculum sp.]